MDTPKPRGEALVYRALVEKGPADYLQLLHSTPVPDGKLHTVLSRLIARGAVETVPSHPAVFRAVSPAVVPAGAPEARELVGAVDALYESPYGSPAVPHQRRRSIPRPRPAVMVKSGLRQRLARTPTVQTPRLGRSGVKASRGELVAGAPIRKSRRSSLRVVSDILHVAGTGARRTHIMYRANLSFEQLNRYLANLVRAALIQVDPARRMYVVTERGLEFLRQYEELHEAEQRSATNRAELLRMLANALPSRSGVRQRLSA